MKILSTLQYFTLHLPIEHRRRHFWKFLTTKQLTVVWKKNTMKVIGYHQQFGYQCYSKYLCVCVCVCVCVQQKKETHTGLEQVKGE